MFRHRFHVKAHMLTVREPDKEERNMTVTRVACISFTEMLQDFRLEDVVVAAIPIFIQYFDGSIGWFSSSRNKSGTIRFYRFLEHNIPCPIQQAYGLEIHC